ncbi:MAG: hypothetical protein OXD29_03115 [Roseovarius sp.]|nr:hypothetical protein [Roseovarius sp.]
MDKPTKDYEAMINKLEFIRNNKDTEEGIRAAFALAYLEKLKTPNATAICNMAKIMEGSFEP